MRTPKSSFATLLLTTIACGPPGVADPQGGDATSSSTEASSESAETETETETETTAETTAEGSEGPGILPKFDLLPDSCDPWQQDCPEGEKCVPYGIDNWDYTKCVPILGDQAVGEPCTWAGIFDATDDCDASSHCWHLTELDDGWVGTCHAFCTGSPDEPQCPPDNVCAITAVLNVCIPTCDPFAQDCEPDETCFDFGGGFFECSPSQGVALGEPCEYNNNCAAGLACIGAEFLPTCDGSTCCSAFCEVGQPDPCPALIPGTSCLVFYEEGTAPQGYDLLGVCATPP